MKSIEFYVNKIKYIEGAENADVSFVPLLQRRKMSLLDRVTISTLNYCYTEDIQYIVFASKTGQIERLLKIIEQYKTGEQTSPMVFTGSVHNYSLSFFLMNEQKSIPYTAVSSGENSFFMGFIASLISNFSNVLFVYSDIENEKYVSICINISKKNKCNSDKFLLTKVDNSDICTFCKEFYELFSGKLNILKTNKYEIERIDNVKSV